MTSRREFLQIAAAAAAVLPNGWSRAFAQQRLAQGDLLAFEPLGNVTLVHLTDIHAQLRPIFFREPSINLGVGEARGEPPHVTGRAFLDRFGIAGRLGRGATRSRRRISPRSPKPTAAWAVSTGSRPC